MKGHNAFSQTDADRIRELLENVRAADRAGQKRFRDRLRNDIGFYISDFTSSNAGFTVADFDGLIASEQITIA